MRVKERLHDLNRRRFGIYILLHGRLFNSPTRKENELTSFSTHIPWVWECPFGPSSFFESKIPDGPCLLLDVKTDLVGSNVTSETCVLTREKICVHCRCLPIRGPSRRPEKRYSILIDVDFSRTEFVPSFGPPDFVHAEEETVFFIQSATPSQ